MFNFVKTCVFSEVFDCRLVISQSRVFLVMKYSDVNRLSRGDIDLSHPTVDPFFKVNATVDARTRLSVLVQRYLGRAPTPFLIKRQTHVPHPFRDVVPVNSLVVSSRDAIEIFYSIVELVVVLVMNYPALWNGSVVVLPDQAMLSAYLSRRRTCSSVSAGIDAAPKLSRHSLPTKAYCFSTPSSRLSDMRRCMGSNGTATGEPVCP